MALTRIHSPLTREASSRLRTGERVSISGRIVTARDRVHAFLAAGNPSPLDLTGLIIYHCGPVSLRQGQDWRIVAAGPTTSQREEPYEAEIIQRFHPGAIMGKGGMGERTLAALEEYGGVYLHLTGGAAAFLAACVTEVRGVYLSEFGLPEAMWEVTVADLPALVTMDSHRRSLHREVERQSRLRLDSLLNPVP